MHEPIRKPTATLRKNRCRPVRATVTGHNASSPLLRKTLRTCLACLLPVLQLVAPAPGAAAETPRPGIGEGYIFNHVAEYKSESAPGKALELSLRAGAQGTGELLDPSSHVWAGAQGLRLRFGHTAVLLAANVIASAGDGQAAAASLADGRIRLFGAGNCTTVSMPGGHPAYALALASKGDVLAAWAQGVNRLAFFDLSAPGCPASTAETALRGQISLTLSASGAYLAAQDESGSLWVGARGGEMRLVASLSGAPAAIGFSEGEGVLLAIDAQGRGGSWNPRTGKALRSLEVPGGPFARGDFHGNEARLWSMGGRLVRWNVLHNRAAGAVEGPSETASSQQEGWLELRGSDLYYARPGQSWRPEAVYEPRLPQLSHSRHADCLRLADVDGMVRYYDARSGSARTQCFADDWTPVAVLLDGTAQIPGLRLCIFDTLSTPGGDSKVNSRALSETEIVLWTERAPDLALRVQAEPTAPKGPSQKVVDSISVPLRQGIAADSPVRALLLK